MQVVELRPLGKVQTTYNPTVANHESYFVGEQRVWVHDCGCKKNLEQQAADLIPLNDGKNRVNLRSEGEQLEIDLAGKAHGGIPTPHTKVSKRNQNAPDHLQPAYNTSEKKSTTRAATQQDIRTARRYLERKHK